LLMPYSRESNLSVGKIKSYLINYLCKNKSKKIKNKKERKEKEETDKLKKHCKDTYNKPLKRNKIKKKKKKGNKKNNNNKKRENKSKKKI